MIWIIAVAVLIILFVVGGVFGCYNEKEEFWGEYDGSVPVQYWLEEQRKKGRYVD